MNLLSAMEDATGILSNLPHRYPFLMVDRMVEVVPGRRAVAIKNVTRDCLAAGVNGDKLYPQIFLLEAMAQVGALAASGPLPGGGPDYGEGGWEPGYLAGINRARFNRIPEIGDQVVFTLDFEAGMGGLVRFRGTAKIGEEVAAESGLTFSAPRRL